MKILYVIKTTKKYLNRIDTVLDTWLNGIDDYIFLSDHEDSEKNIILSSTDSGPWGLIDKSLYFFNNAKNIFLEGKSVLDVYDWILVCDDDTFVNTKKCNEFVMNKDTSDNVAYCSIISPQNNPENAIWAEYHDIFKQYDIFHYHSGGAGILISCNTLSKIHENSNNESPFVKNGIKYEDAGISLNLIKNKVNLIDSELFCSQSPGFYGDSDENVKNKITYHHIDTEKMKTFYSILNG